MSFAHIRTRNPHVHRESRSNPVLYRAVRDLSLGRLGGRLLETLEPRMLLAAAPVGPEFQVNTYVAGDQVQPAVAADADGDFVVVWECDVGRSGDSDAAEVRAQRYNAAGLPQGDEFRVSSSMASDYYQHGPAVAMDQDGDFAIAWVGLNARIYFQRYNAAGAPQAAQVQVGTLPGYWDESPQITMSPSGDFAVAWESATSSHSWDLQVFARCFDAAGNARGDQFLVSAQFGHGPASASIAMDAGGDFVVVLQRGAVIAQRFDAGGAKRGCEFQVNTRASSYPQPAVAMDAAGNFTVAWQSGPWDGGPGGISARRFDADAQPLGQEFLVHTPLSSNGAESLVAAQPNGDFIVTWDESTYESGTAISAQRFNADGTPNGDALRVVNPRPMIDQTKTALALDASGNFIFVWQSRGRDGSGYGIVAQRYEVSSQPASVGDRVWIDANANGVQDPDEKGLDGVRVSLFNAAGVFVTSTVTSAGGLYAFNDVIPAEPFYLEVELPDGYAFTYPGRGDDRAADSDVDPLKGRSGLFQMLPNQSRIDLDVGLMPEASIAGTVYLDANTNGKQDAGDTALGGWALFLDADQDGQLDPAEKSATTHADGSYRFDALWPGSYCVVQQPRQHSRYTSPASGRATVTLQLAQTATGIDFGNRLVPSDVIPAPTEFRVNATIDLDQCNAAVAVNARGDFVVAWQSHGHNGSAYGGDYEIAAQRYDAAGNRQGGEFRVDSPVGGKPCNPVVAIDDTGAFVIAWESFASDVGGSDAYGIFARRYDAAGVPFGGQFQVSSDTFRYPAEPAIAMDADGDFVVTWQAWYRDCTCGPGVYARLYNAQGLPRGGEEQFLVNTNTGGWQWLPDVAMDAKGNFTIAYVDGEFGAVREPAVVKYQRYDAAGNRIGQNTPVPGASGAPAVAMDTGGNFVIAWGGESNDTYPSVDDGYYRPILPTGSDIHAQRFDLYGEPLGPIVLVNTNIPAAKANPDVAIDADGDFVVTWDSLAQDGSKSGVYGRRYNSAGFPEGPEFRANIYTDDHQGRPAVGINATGDFVVAWQSYGQDGSAYGVYARRYAAPADNGSIGDRVWLDADADGIQDPGEGGVEGATVNLYDEFGLRSTTRTDYAGFYRFGDLSPADSYYLQFLPPQGFYLSAQDHGDHDALDSDPSPLTGRTRPFVLFEGQQDMTKDAGLIPAASIFGKVFDDRDADSLRDDGEPGLPQWQVFLDSDADGIADPGETITPTGADGAYRFANLPAGAYRVAILPNQDWVATVSSRSVTVLPGQNVAAIDFPLHNARQPVPIAPLGLEMAVNTFKPANQRHPAVAIDEMGNYVIAWESFAQDGSGYGIYAQRFNPAGIPLGPEFRANTRTLGHQRHPSVAMDHDGDFAIIWERYRGDTGLDPVNNVPWWEYGASVDDPTPDGDFGVFGQLYDADGVAQGGEFTVDGDPITAPANPAASMDADGDFVVVWRDGPRLSARRYTAAAQPRDLEPLVVTNAYGGKAAVAMDDPGNFVVAWEAPGTNEWDRTDIHALRFGADGQRLGAEFCANTNTGEAQLNPAVAMNGQGEFVIAWDSMYLDCTCGPGIGARRFARDGAALGNEFLVNTYTCCWQWNPSAAMDASGSFVITWQSQHQDEDYSPGIYARLFASLPGTEYGAELHGAGDEFRVNTHQLDKQLAPAVAMNGTGDFVVTWQSEKQDGSEYGVYAQRYGRPAHRMPASNGNDDYCLRLDPTGSAIEVFHNIPATGSPTCVIPRNANIEFYTFDGNDTLTLDFSNGNPVPVCGLSFNGTDGDKVLRLVGITSAHSITLDGSRLMIDSIPIAYGVAEVQLCGAVIDLQSLTLTSNATLLLPAGGNTVVRTAHLRISDDAILDLQDNSLIITATPTTRGQVLKDTARWAKNARGCEYVWQKKGLPDSAAPDQRGQFTSLAVLLNDRGNNQGPLLTKFGGVDVTADCVLVKYTYNGDVNLDGVVNADDYFRIDSGFIMEATGYANGDLNYDGVVNADDYFLVDSAFLGQGTPLALAESPDAVAQTPSPAKQKQPRDTLFSQEPIAENLLA